MRGWSSCDRCTDRALLPPWPVLVIEDVSGGSVEALPIGWPAGIDEHAHRQGDQVEQPEELCEDDERVVVDIHGAHSPALAWDSSATSVSRRSEESRVGKGCVSTGRSRWARDHYNNKKRNN